MTVTPSGAEQAIHLMVFAADPLPEEVHERWEVATVAEVLHSWVATALAAASQRLQL